MEQRALQKGCLTAPWRFPAAPRLGNYGAAAVARLLFGSLSDAKGTRTTLPSAAVTASGGEGRSLGSSCLLRGSDVRWRVSRRSPRGLHDWSAACVRALTALRGRARGPVSARALGPGVSGCLLFVGVRAGSETGKEMWRLRAACRRAALSLESGPGAVPAAPLSSPLRPMRPAVGCREPRAGCCRCGRASW